jgi:hypothetical protein
MTFTDEDLKRLKEMSSEMEDETIINTNNAIWCYAQLPRILARLEAAEQGYAAQCKEHGCIEECEAWRKAAGK